MTPISVRGGLFPVTSLSKQVNYTDTFNELLILGMVDLYIDMTTRNMEDIIAVVVPDPNL